MSAERQDRVTFQLPRWVARVLLATCGVFALSPALAATPSPRPAGAESVDGTTAAVAANSHAGTRRDSPLSPRYSSERPELAEAIRDQLERVLWDSKLKYSALVMLTFVPSKLSALAGKTLFAEGMKDVSVAVATAMIDSMELDATQRARARARIAVLKGTGDWNGFVATLVAITGKDAAVLLATLPSTVADLLAGAGEAPLFYAGGLEAGGLARHPYIAPFLLRVAAELEHECDYDAAREVYEEARRNLDEHLPRMIMDAGRNYAGLTGQRWPADVVAENLPRHAYPYEYDEFRYLEHGAAYIGAIKAYDLATRYLEESGRRLSALPAKRDAYLAERDRVADRLSRADELLWDCAPEEGAPLLAETLARCCSRSPLFGPAKPDSYGCWDWAAKEYNRINGIYLRWQRSMAADRDRAERLRDAGFAALSACRLGDAASRLVDLEFVLLKEPICARRPYLDLRSQFEKFQEAGLCQEPARAAEPALVGPTGARATAGATAGLDCAARRRDYHARCRQLADDQVNRACTPVRSGCAGDVAGCLAALIEDALPDDYCLKPGYIGCATGHLETYLGCLNTCNSDFMAGRLSTYHIVDCRLKCQETLDRGTRQCKAAAR